MEEAIINKPINGWDYQDTDRLFFKEGYFYDYVERVEGFHVDDKGEALFDVALLSGDKAIFSLAFHEGPMVRFKFYTEVDPVELSSEGYLEEPPALVAFEAIESDASVTLTSGDLAVVLEKEPFVLRIDRAGKNMFTTSTKKISRQYVTPGLGYRVAGDGTREAFLSWDIDNSEAFYGLGEKFGRVEKTQSRVTGWAMDACGTNLTDMAYKDFPILMSTRGIGVLCDTARRNHWDIGSFCFSSLSYLVESSVLRGYLFFGDDMKALIERCGSLTGRPAIPQPWVFGTWYSRCAYMNTGDIDEVKDKLHELDIPFDVMNLDTHWGKNYWYDKFWVDCTDFEWGEECFPNPTKLFADLWDEGIGCCVWLNPYLPPNTKIYDEGMEKGYLVRTTTGGIAHVKRRITSNVALPDFTNPEAYDWWKGYVKDLLRLGIRVVKPDYADRVPENALFSNGFTGKDMHNYYIYLYVKACFEAVQEVHGTGIVYKRPGFLGTERFGGTWSGDTESTWEGFRSSIRGGLSVGFGGDSIWSCDIAGFKGDMPEPELYIRWSQAGLFFGLGRYHGTTNREPWFYGDKAVDVVRRYTELHYKIAPYYMELAHEASLNSLPLARHMAIEFPQDRVARTIDDQFLVGDSVMVVAIVEKGATERSYYLPEGRWYHIHRKEWLEGGRVVTEPVAIDDAPILVREGSVVPMLNERLTNLKHFSIDQIQLVSFGGNLRAKEGQITDMDGKVFSYVVESDGAVKVDGESVYVREVK